MGLDLAQILLLCALVFAGGFVDSIAGGGGLITLPAYLAVGLPPHAALATNKFSSCLGTLAAVIRFARARSIRYGLALWAAGGALAGSALGTKVALLLGPSTINTIVLVLVPSVLLLFLLKDRLVPDRSPSPSKARRLELTSLAIGLVVGTYDGFFGPGTGTFLTIGFCVFLSLDLFTASANARLANLASNIGSLALFLLHGQVLFPLAFATAAAGIVGNWFGSRLAVAKGAKVIKPLMVGVLLLLLCEVIRRRIG
jgi:uncharacterized membrane protein YfcA